MRQSMLFDVRPLRTAVVGDINSTPGSAAEFTPGAHLDLPHAGEQRVRIMWIHGESGAAHIVGNEEDALPMLAAIGGAVDAFILLRAGGSPQNTGEDYVLVRGINDDPSDAAAFGQAHVRPGLACIGGLVNAI